MWPSKAQIWPFLSWEQCVNWLINCNIDVRLYATGPNTFDRIYVFTTCRLGLLHLQVFQQGGWKYKIIMYVCIFASIHLNKIRLWFPTCKSLQFTKESHMTDFIWLKTYKCIRIPQRSQFSGFYHHSSKCEWHHCLIKKLTYQVIIGHLWCLRKAIQ